MGAAANRTGFLKQFLSFSIPLFEKEVYQFEKHSGQSYLDMRQNRGTVASFWLPVPAQGANSKGRVLFFRGPKVFRVLLDSLLNQPKRAPSTKRHTHTHHDEFESGCGSQNLATHHSACTFPMSSLVCSQRM